MGGPGEAVRLGRPRAGEAVDRPDHADRATLTHPLRPEPGMQGTAGARGSRTLHHNPPPEGRRDGTVHRSHLWCVKRRPEDVRRAMRRPPEKNSQCVRKITMEIVMVGQSTENMEYVRRLLKQKQPGFAAALELAVELVERELSSSEMSRDISATESSCPGPCGSAHPSAVRRSRKDNQARRHLRLPGKHAGCGLCRLR
jgi:hypothetical protein